jgi:uncharacterized membrane protein
MTFIKRFTYWIGHKELVAVVTALAVIAQAAVNEFGDTWPSMIVTVVFGIITRANVYSRDSVED